MITSAALRGSIYLPPMLAATALGYAEASFLPEVGVFSAAIVVALATIYRLESRVRPLTQGEFNRLGAAIAVVAVLWAAYRILRELKTGEFAAMGWVAFLVALVAPILLALVCALMLRRDKTPRDYWFVLAASLAAIVFAGAMAEEATLVALTAAYGVSTVWFLTLFFDARCNSVSDSRLSPIVRTILWSAMAAALAVPLYLLTPRSTFDKLDFGQPRIEVGFAADQMIDLTQTGDLRENPETAFEVVAKHPDGQPKEDLPADQRWRGSLLLSYTNGLWKRDPQAKLYASPTIRTLPGPWSPPNLGSEAFELEFAVPTRLRSRFLLDPVEWNLDGPSPVAERQSNGTFEAWSPVMGGRIFAWTGMPREGVSEYRYVQHARPPREKDLSPPYSGSVVEIHRSLVENPVRSVKDYSDRVIDELVASGRLLAAVRNRDTVKFQPSPDYHEAIALAFRDHLAERADLSYTTNLQRVNKGVDPVEDFLFYSKAGHCERFASALVLMLRSQGIPSVVILGFKGCEHQGGGRYLVRQEHAHAWAEALIPRRNLEARRIDRHWLSLDPAPTQTVLSESKSGVAFWSRAALERFLFRYTAEERARSIRGFGQAITSLEVMLGVPAFLTTIFCLRFALRRWSRRAGAESRSTRWYSRLVAIAASQNITPAPGETPRELANRLSQMLPTPQAGIVGEWVEAHYRNRFGASPQTDDEEQRLELRFAELERNLRDSS